MIVRTGNAPCLHHPGCPHDLGPSTPAPLRGFSHRGHEVAGGSFARALPEPRHQPDAPRTCGMCGEPLPPRRSTHGRLQEWCSQACRQRAYMACAADRVTV